MREVFSFFFFLKKRGFIYLFYFFRKFHEFRSDVYACEEKEIISFDEQQNKFPQNQQLFHAIILARRNEPSVVRETFFLPSSKSAKTFRFVSNPSVAGRQFASCGKRAYKEPITYNEQQRDDLRISIGLRKSSS